MNKIGIFYASSGGKSEFVADLIKRKYEENCDVFNVEEHTNLIENYSKLIFIIPSYGIGKPHPYWTKSSEKLKEIDFTEKQIGLIGRGNQEFYPNTFVSGVRPIYDILVENNASIKGFTSSKGYNFVHSDSVIGDQFICLVLDELYMLKELKEKLEAWLENLFD